MIVTLRVNQPILSDLIFASFMYTTKEISKNITTMREGLRTYLKLIHTTVLPENKNNIFCVHMQIRRSRDYSTIANERRCDISLKQF